jgi:hypothetical protein
MAHKWKDGAVQSKMLTTLLEEWICLIRIIIYCRLDLCLIKLSASTYAAQDMIYRMVAKVSRYVTPPSSMFVAIR